MCLPRPSSEHRPSLTTHAHTEIPIKARRSYASYAVPGIALLLVLFVVFWLAKNIQHDGTAYFVTIAFIGLTNGALYALVALGYTLVYGILELINFAHGDVFMLGGMFSATMVISAFHLKAGASTGALVAAIVGLAARRDGRVRPPQRRDRACRLPAAAQRAATGAADHRDRDVVHPREHRASPGRGRATPPSRTCCRTAGVFSIGGVDVHVGEAHRRRSSPCPCSWSCCLARPAHAAGQGDARDRAGPGRGGDDGHRRQPDDLVHVPARGRARRRGRPRLRALLRADPLRHGLPARPDRVHRRRASAASATCPAPSSARS